VAAIRDEFAIENSNNRDLPLGIPEDHFIKGGLWLLRTGEREASYGWFGWFPQ
jgi:hypothetical protein